MAQSAAEGAVKESGWLVWCLHNEGILWVSLYVVIAVLVVCLLWEILVQVQSSRAVPGTGEEGELDNKGEDEEKVSLDPFERSSDDEEDDPFRALLNKANDSGESSSSVKKDKKSDDEDEIKPFSNTVDAITDLSSIKRRENDSAEKKATIPSLVAPLAEKSSGSFNGSLTLPLGESSKSESDIGVTFAPPKTPTSPSFAPPKPPSAVAPVPPKTPTSPSFAPPKPPSAVAPAPPKTPVAPSFTPPKPPSAVASAPPKPAGVPFTPPKPPGMGHTNIGLGATGVNLASRPSTVSNAPVNKVANVPTPPPAPTRHTSGPVQRPGSVPLGGGVPHPMTAQGAKAPGVSKSATSSTPLPASGGSEDSWKALVGGMAKGPGAKPAPSRGPVAPPRPPGPPARMPVAPPRPGVPGRPSGVPRPDAPPVKGVVAPPRPIVPHPVPPGQD
ncbi:hypothetical protein IJT10_04900, partial [bacterium]|nr:hypothetical protein [bacterium]